MKEKSILFACISVLLLCSLCAFAQNSTDHSASLKYVLTVSPDAMKVNRKPGTNPPRIYKERFTFEVKNETNTDFDGNAPSCQLFDIKVVSLDAPDQPIWKASDGQMFCQMVTPVKIAHGKAWTKSIKWQFTADKVKDGKYRATANFTAVPDKVEVVDFEITSVK